MFDVIVDFMFIRRKRIFDLKMSLPLYNKIHFNYYNRSIDMSYNELFTFYLTTLRPRIS